MLTRQTRSKSASDVVSMVPTWAMPALLTRMDSGPAPDSAASKAAFTSAASETSQRIATALPPAARMASAVARACSSWISRTATRAPCLANSWQMAWPMPEPPPVTMAVLPLRSNMRRAPVASVQIGDGLRTLGQHGDGDAVAAAAGNLVADAPADVAHRFQMRAPDVALRQFAVKADPGLQRHDGQQLRLPLIEHGKARRRDGVQQRARR